MPRTSGIIEANRGEEIKSLLKEGRTLRQIAKISGFTISQIRSFKAITEEEERRKLEADESAINSLRRQNERLKDLLFRAQRAKPLDMDLLLKIEGKLSENVRYIAALSKDDSDNESEAEKAALEAQISSLIKLVQESVDDCPRCRKAIRANLGAFMKDAGK